MTDNTPIATVSVYCEDGPLTNKTVEVTQSCIDAGQFYHYDPVFGNKSLYSVNSSQDPERVYWATFVRYIE